MLFKPEPDLGSEPNRPKTLAVSIAFHFLLIAVLVLFPDLFRNDYKAVVRIAGQDYDLSQVRELTLALPTPMPRPAPNPAPPPPPAPDAPPLAEPPTPQPRPQPPPPPPQQQQQPQPPNVVITPEDVLADGARPDATQKASRGNTEERGRAGGMSNDPPKPEPGGPLQPPKPEQAKGNPPQIAQNNTDPNSLRPPNLLDRRDQIIGQQSEQRRRDMQNGGGGGVRTGVGHGLDEPNFSAEGDLTILSDTRGYDFGPYLNQVLNKVRANWYAQMPERARLGAKGRVIIHFTITKTGLVEDLRIVSNSGLEPLDRAAQGSITASNPFQKLPPGFDGDMLRLQFAYYYNIRP